MGAPAAKTLEIGPLSLDGLQRLMEQLPAEVRARLAWVPKELSDSLSVFLDGSRDEAALHVLLVDLGRVMSTVTAAIVSAAEHQDLLRTELEEAWRKEAGVLRAYLDPDAADLADWTIRGWVALTDMCLTLMGATLEEVKRALAAADQATFAEAVTQQGSPLRVQALLMAAIEGARRSTPQHVVAELVERSFEEMNGVIAQLRTAGLHVAPFTGETIAERAERTRRYAEHIRNALDDEDRKILDASRLRELR